MNRRHRATAVVPAIVLLLSGNAASPAPMAGQAGSGFSRAEWIAARLAQAPFSGGVVPALGDGLAATRPVPPMVTAGPGAVALDAGIGAAVRVNNDLLAPGGGTHPESQAEPYLTINPLDPDNLIAGYQENRFRGGGARGLGFATSFDGGLTWEEGLLPGLTFEQGGPWERASDPWVEFGPGHRAYYVSLLFNQTDPRNAVGVSVSTDGGRSWGLPVEVFRSELDFNDKEAIEVDTFATSPFFGNVYVGWDVNVAEGPSAGDQRLVVARSVDGGASYEAPVVVRDSRTNIGAVPRVGPDGTVHLIWMGTIPGGRHVFYSRSLDGGRSWAAPRPIAQLLSNGVPEHRTGTNLPSIAVDRRSGDLYVAWQDARWTGVDQATLTVSRDGGDTWSSPIRVSDGPGDALAFTAAVAVDGGGRVGVVYTSLRNDPLRRFFIDQYVAVSEDGGRSFGPSRRVTPASTDVRFAAWARGWFLGDYQGMAGGPDRFHMLWVAPTLPSRLEAAFDSGDAAATNPPTGVDSPGELDAVHLQSDVFTATAR